MGENEFIIAIVSVLSLFVLMPATIIRGILQFQKHKQSSTSTPSGSVGMKELEIKMEEAVIRATAPLQQKLDRLERQLTQLTSMSGKPVETLESEDLLEEDTFVTREKTVGRSGRQRSV